MEVGSISSTISTFTPPAQGQRSDQAQRAERPESPPAQAERSERARNDEQRPAPVVNAQGQRTGTIVNTSA